MHLFVIYIGGSHSQSLIELHDIRFVIANTIEETYDALRQSWWGDATSLHLDAWGILNYADLSVFPWQILMECLEIYLWTKNNWSGESAPGGENNQNWLQAIHHKIIDREWMIALPHLIRN